MLEPNAHWNDVIGLKCAWPSVLFPCEAEVGKTITACTGVMPQSHTGSERLDLQMFSISRVRL